MNEACPDYYKMSPYVDLNHWAARKLEASPWTRRDDAILLHVLWVEMLRYVVRLPFKATNAAGAISDIDKAISLLQDMRAALQAPDAEETPKKYSPQVRLTQREAERYGDDTELPQAPEPEQDEAPLAYATLATATLELEPAALHEIQPWEQLTPSQQAHIRKYRMNNETWFHWQRPNGDSEVFSAAALYIPRCGGTVRQIAIPELAATPHSPAPACPQCGKPLDPSTAGFASRGDWWCVPCLKAYWNHDVAPTIPWDALPSHEQEHIRNCDGRGGPWYRLLRPSGNAYLLNKEGMRLYDGKGLGTLYRIAVPQEVCG